jgi:adapter protein MecA 1/2
MKIEKMNENQIRCTLTKEDLASRQLKLSELAYGTEKAKTLFRDMMQQANFEFGFEAEDIPLMIEAIPMNAESIVLIITKVEDPEELDTRFSRFAPDIADEEYIDEDEDDEDDDSDEISDLFRRIQGKRQDAEVASEPETDQKLVRIRLFAFDSLSPAIDAAKVTASNYEGAATLYKDEKHSRYLLALVQGESSPETFDRVSNIISEYGTLQKASVTGLSYLEEHCEVLIADDALSRLGSI